MRHYHRAVQLPAVLGADVIGVAAGEEVSLDVRLESVMEGVLASGTASAPVTGQCARCLDPLAVSLEVDVTELFAYPDSATDASTDFDEVSRVVDGLVDLEPVVHDALLLGLPSVPLCDEGCPGLCPDCGGKWVELGTDHRHETMDSRWAVLASGLTQRLPRNDEENK